VPDSAVSADFHHSDRPAVITSRRTMSYRQFNRAVLLAAGRLRDEGVQQGQFVGVALGQTPEALVLLRALARLGAAACMIDPRWPEKEVARAASAANCSRIMRKFDLQQSGAPPQLPEPGHSRPATVVFTSGSTGLPKPAVHSAENHIGSAVAANANIPLKPGDRWLLSLPLHHVAGIAITFRCALAGTAVAVPEPGTPLPEALQAFRPTHISLVPTQLARLLADETATRRLAEAKAVLMGGAPMPPPLVQSAFDRGIPIHTSYGLTETSSQITATPPGAYLDALLTSGKPLTPGAVAISDAGEVLVRGKTLFLGYIQNGELHRPLAPDGWFATGDLGRFDEHGRLVVEGRRDNMFVSGGENVLPEEIERRLCELPGIDQALVIPIPDNEYGEVGIAYIKTRGKQLDPSRLKAQLREQLPPHKIPKQFRPWPPDLPNDVLKSARRKTAQTYKLHTFKP